MHCQQRLVAYFYAIWGTFTNGTWDSSLPSLRGQLGDSSFAAIEELDNVVVSDIRQLDGTGCAVSLSCPVKPRCSGTWFPLANGEVDTDYNNSESAAELNLTLTLTSSDFRANGVPRCKDRLEEFLFNKQKDGLYNPQSFPGPLLPLTQAGKEASDPEPKPDQSHLRQRRPTPASQSKLEQRLDSRSQTVDYSRLFGYLLSSISQRQAIQEAAHAARDWKLNLRGPLKRVSLPAFPHNPIHSPRRWKQGSSNTSSNHRSVCEESSCKAYDLEKICGQHKKPNFELDTENVCRMCYPRMDVALVKEHCEERARREVLVFRVLCVVLGILVVVATLLYVLREICRPMGKRWQIFWKVRSSPTSSALSSRLSSIFSVESNPASPPGHFFKSRNGSSRNEYDVEIPSDTFTRFQDKLSNFGGFGREPRKRAQDVFDLEALQLGHGDKEEGLAERIPVLPRAPNASIRESTSNRTPTRGGNGTHETISQDADDGAATIHTSQHTIDTSQHFVS